MIGAIVLAAGLGTRFRSSQRPADDVGATHASDRETGSKVVALAGGVPLVRLVVERLARVPVRHLVVVAGSDQDAVRTALAGTLAAVVANPRPERGLSSSLAVGIDALPPECDAAVIALGDQPMIDPVVVRALLEVWESSNAAAVVPRYRDAEWGHPIVIDLSLRDRLSMLEGDVGARDVLRSLGDRLVRLAVDANAPLDVDRPDDLVKVHA